MGKSTGQFQKRLSIFGEMVYNADIISVTGQFRPGIPMDLKDIWKGRIYECNERKV